MRSEKGRRAPNPSVLGGPRVLHTDTDGDSLALTAGALLTGLIVICTLRKGAKKHGQSGTEPAGTRLDTLTPRKATTAHYQAHQLVTESATTRRLDGKTRPERFTLHPDHQANSPDRSSAPCRAPYRSRLREIATESSTARYQAHQLVTESATTNTRLGETPQNRTRQHLGPQLPPSDSLRSAYKGHYRSRSREITAESDERTLVSIHALAGDIDHAELTPLPHDPPHIRPFHLSNTPRNILSTSRRPSGRPVAAILSVAIAVTSRL